MNFCLLASLWTQQSYIVTGMICRYGSFTELSFASTWSNLPSTRTRTARFAVKCRLIRMLYARNWEGAAIREFLTVFGWMMALPPGLEKQLNSCLGELDFSHSQMILPGIHFPSSPSAFVGDPVVFQGRELRLPRFAPFSLRFCPTSSAFSHAWPPRHIPLRTAS